MNKFILRVNTSLRNIKPVSQWTKIATRYLSDSNQKGTEPEKMDELKTNPYFEKYQEKLKKVYDENPETFLNNLKEKKKVEPIGNPEDYGYKTESKMSKSANKQRTLDSIMKIDKVDELEAEAIRAIWITFISELGKIPGMINDKEYDLIARRSSEFTSFLFPLPREQGFEFILAQWAGHECHFTPLINFQAHGADAPSIMTIVYFDELLKSKKFH